MKGVLAGFLLGLGVAFYASPMLSLFLETVSVSFILASICLIAGIILAVIDTYE